MQEVLLLLKVIMEDQEDLVLQIHREVVEVVEQMP
tara:strand:- start:296 stop:400 length:105 start_codon:yes stop_codon:yes gene_type:complete